MKVITIMVSSCSTCPNCWAGCECTAIGESSDDYREITPAEYRAGTTPDWCPLEDAKENKE